MEENSEFLTKNEDFEELPVDDTPENNGMKNIIAGAWVMFSLSILMIIKALI